MKLIITTNTILLRIKMTLIIKILIRLTTGIWVFFLLVSLPLTCRITFSNSREPIMELGLKVTWFWFVEISLMTWSDGTRWCCAHNVTRTSITGLLQTNNQTLELKKAHFRREVKYKLLSLLTLKWGKLNCISVREITLTQSHLPWWYYTLKT